MSKFFTLLTQIGEAKLANATALGQSVQFAKLAVGDGGGTLPTPDKNQTSLVNEVHRASLNSIATDPGNVNWIICEQVVPENIGGWTIREVGIYDIDGDLIAIGNFPETYKPILEEGSGRTQTIRIVLQVSSSSSVELKIDPSVVLATSEYVDSKVIPATEINAGIARIATDAETLDKNNNQQIITPKKLNQFFLSYGQFQLYNPERVYSVGETCYTQDASGVQFWQWYSNVEALANKDPLDTANRHIGWTDPTKPFYWLPYTGDAAGTPFYWLSETEPEHSVMELGIDLPIAVYWRLAQAYPALVNGSTINTGEIRGEFLRVWDNGRGQNPNQLINAHKPATQIPFVAVYANPQGSFLVTPALLAYESVSATDSRVYPKDIDGAVITPSMSQYMRTPPTTDYYGATTSAYYSACPSNIARAMAITI